MNNIRQAILLMPTPLDNDGKVGQKLSQEVIDNTVKFFESLPAFYRKTFNPLTQMTPTPHGTITLDWMDRKNLLCVEVGKTHIGFFSDLPDGTSPSATILFDDKAIKAVGATLDRLYGRKVS